MIRFVLAMALMAICGIHTARADENQTLPTLNIQVPRGGWFPTRAQLQVKKPLADDKNYDLYIKYPHFYQRWFIVAHKDESGGRAVVPGVPEPNCFGFNQEYPKAPLKPFFGPLAKNCFYIYEEGYWAAVEEPCVLLTEEFKPSSVKGEETEGAHCKLPQNTSIETKSFGDCDQGDTPLGELVGYYKALNYRRGFLLQTDTNLVRQLKQRGEWDVLFLEPPKGKKLPVVGIELRVQGKKHLGCVAYRTDYVDIRYD